MKLQSKRLKPLLPSLKEKKRYVAFEVISEKKVQSKDVSKAVISSCLRTLGLLTTSSIGVKTLSEKYNNENQRGLIRVSSTGVNQLKASLAFIDSIEGQPAIVHSIGVSGILAKAQKKYVGG